jgi:hypothetical protein
MTTTKTHYRKVFKSDHLGVADLEDLIEQKKPLIFTIKEVKQEWNVMVAGKKGNHNIAYFVEPIKPLVVNAGNSKILKSFAPHQSPMVEDWKGLKVELYINNDVKFGKDVVSGVRIMPVQPKGKPIFTEANFEKAKKNGATEEKIKAIYEASDEILLKYEQYGK